MRPAAIGPGHGGHGKCGACGYDMAMRQSIGIRQLRDALSRILGRVRAGTEIVVTDHGKPVALLTPLTAPLGGDADELRLAELAAQGRLRLGRRFSRFPRPLAVPGVDLPGAVIEEREERG